MACLKLTILYANDIHSASHRNGMDCYVVVSADGVVLERTRRAERSCDPVWNQSFMLQPKRADTLQLAVYGHRSLHDDELLGAADAAVSGPGPEPLTLPLAVAGAPAGTLTIRLQHGSAARLTQRGPSPGVTDSGHGSPCSSPSSRASTLTNGRSHSPQRLSPTPSWVECRPPIHRQVSSPTVSRFGRPSSLPPAIPHAGFVAPADVTSGEGLTITGQKYAIRHQGDAAFLCLSLPEGTAIQARHGTLLAHTAGVAAVPSEITHGPDHPVCSPHLYVNVLRAGDGDGNVYLTQPVFGSVAVLHLDGNAAWLIAPTAFLASTAGIAVTRRKHPHPPAHPQPANQPQPQPQPHKKGEASPDGLPLLRVSGFGTVFLSAFGHVHSLPLEAGQEMVVAAAHLLALPDGTGCQPDAPPGGDSHGADTAMCRFVGPATLQLQTKSPAAFGALFRRH